MRKWSFAAALLLLVGAIVSCDTVQVASPEAQAGSTTAVPALDLEGFENGEPDGNGHPNVGLIGFDLDGSEGPLPPFAICTSFVVSESVLVTAAHCIEVAPGAGWAVTLEPGSPSEPVAVPGTYPDDFPFPIIPSVVYAEEVVMHPRFGEKRSRANDVAVLLFPDGTFAGVEPAELPREGELDAWGAHGGLGEQSFTLVGYGTFPLIHPVTDEIDRSTQKRISNGYRHVASAPFQALTPESLVLQVTQEATDAGFTCAGDSGGPQFFGASDLAVSLVGGPTNQGGICGTGTRYLQRLDTPVIREFLGEYVDLP